MNTSLENSGPIAFVEETGFGLWFLDTNTWFVHVLTRALNDLQGLLEPGKTYADILDVGCGRGKSCCLLDQRFQPQSITALDPDAHLLRATAEITTRCQSKITLLQASATAIPASDASFDMVFCRQTFHHIADQESAIREFYRVLRPGEGVVVR